jgi:hypothetical protein
MGKIIGVAADKPRTHDSLTATSGLDGGCVNGNRKLISCRQVKFDQFGVHSVSAGSVWTRPRSRFFSR